MNKEVEVCDAYTKFALHIYACKQEVTLDKIKDLCNETKIEFQSRLASMFVMPKERYANLLMAINSAPAGGASGSGEKDNKTKEEKKEVVIEEESDVEDGFMDFD